MQLPHPIPLSVEAVNGEVLVSGTCGVVVSLAPDAAAETSDRLLAAATQAKAQLLQLRSSKAV